MASPTVVTPALSGHSTDAIEKRLEAYEQHTRCTSKHWFPLFSMQQQFYHICFLYRHLDHIFSMTSPVLVLWSLTDTCQMVQLYVADGVCFEKNVKIIQFYLTISCFRRFPSQSRQMDTPHI